MLSGAYQHQMPGLARLQIRTFENQLFFLRGYGAKNKAWKENPVDVRGQNAGLGFSLRTATVPLCSALAQVISEAQQKLPMENPGRFLASLAVPPRGPDFVYTSILRQYIVSIKSLVKFKRTRQLVKLIYSLTFLEPYRGGIHFLSFDPTV